MSVFCLPAEKALFTAQLLQKKDGMLVSYPEVGKYIFLMIRDSPQRHNLPLRCFLPIRGRKEKRNE